MLRLVLQVTVKRVIGDVTTDVEISSMILTSAA